MKVIGGLLVIIAYALMSSSVVVWGVYWIYSLVTTDAGFFVALIHSAAGLALQLLAAFCLFVSGYVLYSPDDAKRKFK